MIFEDVRPNEWIQPIRKGYKLACCDCALVHTMDFRLHKGHIQFRSTRNNRSTGQMRRHLKQKLIPKEVPKPLDKPERML